MNCNSDTLERCTGTNFENMANTLAGVARLEASPIRTTEGFSWAGDGWSNGTVTFTELACNTELYCRPTSDAPASLTVFVPRDGVCGMRLGVVDAIASPGQILLGHNHEASRFLAGGTLHRSETLFIDWKLVSKAFVEWFDAPLSGSLGMHPVIDESSMSGPLFINLVEALTSGLRKNGGLRHSPLAMASLTEGLAHLLVGSIRHCYSGQVEQQKFTPVPWHVRRAIDFMHANIGNPITISTVAQSINVSVRALEQGFRAFKGTTPASYLRTLRMQAARKDLLELSNRQSVKTICLKWGFFHAGRFSAFYKSVYGETPQATKERKSRK